MTKTGLYRGTDYYGYALFVKGYEVDAFPDFNEDQLAQAIWAFNDCHWNSEEEPVDKFLLPIEYLSLKESDYEPMPT